MTSKFHFQPYDAIKGYIVDGVTKLICDGRFFEIRSYFEVHPVVGTDNALLFKAPVKGIEPDVFQTNFSQKTNFV
jgi:elongation factor P--beta-lysine ligase